MELGKRCNKWPDCSDASDEDDCVYLLPPPATYRSFLPPSDSTPVGLTVNITDVHDINVSSVLCLDASRMLNVLHVTKIRLKYEI